MILRYPVQRQRFPSRARFQQGISGHDHARSAEPALDSSVVYEGLLDRMELAARREALDGEDLRALALEGQYQAGVHHFPVQQHRAGPALTLAAAVLGASQLQVIAEDIEQAGQGRNPQPHGLSVDIES